MFLLRSQHESGTAAMQPGQATGRTATCSSLGPVCASAVRGMLYFIFRLAFVEIPKWTYGFIGIEKQYEQRTATCSSLGPVCAPAVRWMLSTWLAMRRSCTSLRSSLTMKIRSNRDRMVVCVSRTLISCRPLDCSHGAGCDAAEPACSSLTCGPVSAFACRRTACRRSAPMAECPGDLFAFAAQ